MRSIDNTSIFKDNDNISITGYRIISILKMLIEKPCSEEEINNSFINNPLVSRSLSKDTIGIYINTLRMIGCNILRPSRTNSFKYELKAHPFGLYLSRDEIKTLSDLRDNLLYLEDWKLILKINSLIKSIQKNLTPQSITEESILRLKDSSSYLSDNKVKVIKNLEKYCEEKRTILLKYISPSSGEKLIEVIADSIFFENGCFYLWCFNIEQDEVQYLRIDRIAEIKIVKIKKNTFIKNSMIAKYQLKGMQAAIFESAENEKIIEKNEDSLIIEANIRNKFKFIQKILSLGPDCTIIEPENLKNELIAKLYSMSKVYSSTKEL